MPTANKADIKNNSLYLWIIGTLSVVVPIAVAVLFYMQRTGGSGFNNLDVRVLPHLNAVINSTTAFVLLIGYYFIKKGKQKEHRAAMLTAFTLSSIFLISYVIYHYIGKHTLYGGDGFLKVFYLLILFSHIVLSVVVVPLVLLSIYYGLTRQNQKHKKLAKWTFPVWLYVSVSGVLVYLMISPYYAG